MQQQDAVDTFFIGNTLTVNEAGRSTLWNYLLPLLENDVVDGEVANYLLNILDGDQNRWFEPIR